MFIVPFNTLNVISRRYLFESVCMPTTHMHIDDHPIFTSRAFNFNFKNPILLLIGHTYQLLKYIRVHMLALIDTCNTNVSIVYSG